MKAQQNKIQKHERNIADLETRLATAKPVAKSDFYMIHPSPSQLLAEYNAQKQQLDTEMEQWAAATEELDGMEREKSKYE